MKKNIILSIAAAMIALPVSAQDGPPPPPPNQSCDCKCDCGCQGGHNRHDRQRKPHRPKMNPEMRGMAILGRTLVMEKYDKDKDGKISEEEIIVIKEDMKKERETRRAEMLKKFDKDGDGKLSKEERQAMREEWEKAHPDIVKKMEERRAEMMKKFDKDGDGKLSPEEREARHDAIDADRPHRPGHEGKGPHKKGKHGMDHRGAIAGAGMTLLMQKYDTDKDGVLSESEDAAMKADAKKAFEEKKAARKADKADKPDMDDDMPPPPAPPEEAPENDAE